MTVTRRMTFDAPSNMMVSADPPETSGDPIPDNAAVSPVWVSPSFYLAISLYVLPLLSLVFHTDYSGSAQALSQAAAGIGTVVYLVMRELHKKSVLDNNVALASLRVHRSLAAPVPPDDEHEARLLTLETHVGDMYEEQYQLGDRVTAVERTSTVARALRAAAPTAT